MKLANARNAVVPQAKITDYLLSETHFDGRHKAVFFRSIGFSLENWQLLDNALRTHPMEHEVARVEPSPYGTRYVVDGIIPAPDGRRPMVRSIWFVDNQDETQTPRFVSAYPTKRTKSD